MSRVSRQTIIPALRYQDAWGALAFLERAFGFERLNIFEGPDHTIAHGELRLGSACIGINSATAPAADNPWTTVRRGLYVVLPDAAAVNALAERASAHGARVVQPPRDTGYGSRECSLWDPDDHLWSFGTYTWAPEGPPALSAALQYRDASTAIDWLTQVAGFRPGLVVRGEGQAIAHAELHLDGSVLMLGTASDAPAWAGERQGTCVVVNDPDVHYTWAVKAGATVVSPLADTPYGAREYTVTDPEGFVWTFGTYRPPPLPA